MPSAPSHCALSLLFRKRAKGILFVTQQQHCGLVLFCIRHSGQTLFLVVEVDSFSLPACPQFLPFFHLETIRAAAGSISICLAAVTLCIATHRRDRDGDGRELVPARRATYPYPRAHALAYGWCRRVCV